MAREDNLKITRNIKMKIFIYAFAALLVLCSTATFAGGEFITLPSGQVIAVPDDGDTCEFDQTYCTRGWAPNGTFPGLVFGAAVFDRLETCAAEARDYPVCPERGGLVLGPQSSPYPCYELNTGAPE